MDDFLSSMMEHGVFEASSPEDDRGVLEQLVPGISFNN